jgi:hypothetical protein
MGDAFDPTQRKGAESVENFIRIGLVTIFYVFSAVALLPNSYADENYKEYYRYKDPYGRLVISNKTPPPGSTILKMHKLLEVGESQNTQPQPNADPQPNGPSQSPSERKRK